MSPQDLSQIGAGFSDLALGSQAVFRATLQALSLPGRPVAVPHDAETPAEGHPASAAVLLALLDADCSLWLSPRLANSPAAAWLRFHTGCQLTSDLAQARFAWVAAGDALPDLAGMALGSDADPDQSATCVVDLPQDFGDAAAPGAWTLRGPGIPTTQALAAPGLPADFALQWQANHAAFPRGVDLLLASATEVVGLPRTTQISLVSEA